MSMAIGQVLDELKTAKPAISAAIIAKGGTVTGGFSTFSTDIFTIPSGGSSINSAPVEGGVNFYDYDGTFVTGYTLDAAHALTALPSPPDHSSDEVPLTFQSWNYTLEEVTTTTGPIDAGATYITTDGKTHFKVRITQGSGGVLTLYFKKTRASDTLVVDFGNGQVQTNNSTTDVTISASPALSIGEYDIAVSLIGEGTYSLGRASSATVTIGGAAAGLRSTLLKVNIGAKVTACESYSFSYSPMLQYISIPNGVGIDAYVFSAAYALKYIVIPYGTPNIPSQAFSNATNLRGMSLPQSILTLGTSAVSYAYTLKTIVLPKNVVSLSNNCFRYAYSLSEVYMYDALTTIGDYGFGDCSSLSKLRLSSLLNVLGPYVFSGLATVKEVVARSNIKTIDQSAFLAERTCLLYDFTACTSIPTLVNTNAFSGISGICVIKVPASLYNSWKAATNWITYANYLVPV